jgi:hypothetical protein
VFGSPLAPCRDRVFHLQNWFWGKLLSLTSKNRVSLPQKYITWFVSFAPLWIELHHYLSSLPFTYLLFLTKPFTYLRTPSLHLTVYCCLRHFFVVALKIFGCVENRLKKTLFQKKRCLLFSSFSKAHLQSLPYKPSGPIILRFIKYYKFN